MFESQPIGTGTSTKKKKKIKINNQQYCGWFFQFQLGYGDKRYFIVCSIALIFFYEYLISS
jgi:hypothetical protein